MVWVRGETVTVTSLSKRLMVRVWVPVIPPDLKVRFTGRILLLLIKLSSTAVTVTTWGVRELLGVNVSWVGDTLTSGLSAEIVTTLVPDEPQLGE